MECFGDNLIGAPRESRQKGLHENAECRSPGVLKMRSVENAER